MESGFNVGSGFATREDGNTRHEETRTGLEAKTLIDGEKTQLEQLEKTAPASLPEAPSAPTPPGTKKDE